MLSEREKRESYILLSRLDHLELKTLADTITRNQLICNTKEGNPSLNLIFFHFGVCFVYG